MGEPPAAGIGGRFQAVKDRIRAAAARSGRDTDAVRLVVVTKGHPISTIRAAIEAGADCFGENYAEEAVPKIEALADDRLTWVMIGHIQSRKSGLIAAHFDALHTLDSVKLARRLDTAREDGEPLDALIQVNVSGEAAKSGLPGWDREHLPELAAFIEQVTDFKNLRLRGLMTVPPFLPPEEVRPYFRRLAELRDRLQARLPGTSLDQLSMGMSADFEAAVEEGATIVRIGTAIFGPR